MNNVKTLLLAGAAAVMVPMAASAVEVTNPNVDFDLSANKPYTYSFDLEVGGSQAFNFTALDSFSIDSFAISGTGNNAGNDLATVTFGFEEPLTETFSTIVTSGRSSAGFGFLDGRSVNAGDMWSVLFQDGVTDDVSMTLSFSTEAANVAPVPVPAAGLLLGGALLGGGAFAARRKKKAA